MTSYRMNTRPVLLACLMAFSCLRMQAQKTPFNYDENWRKVDSILFGKSLPATAETRVNAIYNRAVQDKNDAQMIKALLYRIRIMNMREVNADLKSIAQFDSAARQARQPARSILQNMEATLYWRYYQNNRYKFMNRTVTTTTISKDPATWAPQQFFEKITQLFLSSLGDEPLLQHTILEDYEPILTKGNTRSLRPTLFDLLTHSALDFFTTDETRLNEPANIFELSDSAAFAPAAIFANHRFLTTDSSSNQWLALGLYQRLIRFHLADTHPEALIDLDIERLGFINQISVGTDKEQSWQQALHSITDRYDDLPAADQAWYLQAQYYATRADAAGSDEGDSANRYDYIKAKEICDRVIARKDGSEGWFNCKNLLHTIQSRTLELKAEAVNIPGQPFRSLMTWRNIDKVYIRIIPIAAGQVNDLDETGGDEFWKKVLSKSALRNSSIDLPSTKDFQPHSAEIKIDALPVGDYILIASGSPDFAISQNPMSAQLVHVSALSYVGNGNDYFILDRETGQPKQGVHVQTWTRTYNSTTRKNTLEKGDAFTSDEQGHVSVAKTVIGRNSYNWFLELTTKTDHLFLANSSLRIKTDQPVQTISAESYEASHRISWLFTDRSIYRPGQTVYFKGIVTTRDQATGRPKIQPGLKTKIMLHDANWANIDSIEVTTNAYGSYNGRFVLPEHTLNGGFSIQDMNTSRSQQFSVEEYKRPKFRVGFDTLKQTARINDSIYVRGNAIAFAGNNVSGAKVTYRVTRTARYPIWYGYLGYRTNPTVINGQEITHGITQTDANGKFDIHFVALPDRHAAGDKDIIYQYSVSADVVDINGETRSGTTSIPVGYKAIQLSFEPLQETMQVDQFKDIRVKATDLSENEVPARITVSLFPVQTPGRLIRERLWDRPDQFLMDRVAYLRDFPFDDYNNELDRNSWPKGAKLAETTDSAGKTLSLLPGGRLLAPGVYYLVATTTDRYGQEVKTMRYVELYGKTEPAVASWLWSPGSSENDNFEPGQKVEVQIASSTGHAFVIRRTLNGLSENSPTFDYLNLDKTPSGKTMSIEEKDRGGFIINDIAVLNNRMYIVRHKIDVPWTNKDLSVEYLSFRDNTLPGSEEKWNLRISGYKKEKVTAEVLTTMYDASLDEFRPHNWRVPHLYPVTEEYYLNQWNAGQNFVTGDPQNLYPQDTSDYSYAKEYDRLLDENLNRYLQRGMYSNSGEMFVRGDVLKKVPAPSAVITLAVPDLARDVTSYRAAPMAKSFQHDMNPDIRWNSPDEAAATSPSAPPPADIISVRKNLNETAFFFPDLQTDADGNLQLSFTMPEALTKWRMMLLAHTKDLAFGYAEKSIVTQKKLMVQPNIPRFLREGDRMTLSAKIVNLTDSEMTGQAELQLTDPVTGQTADGRFTNRQPNQYFTVGAGQSSVVEFPIDIPFQYNHPLTWRIVAHARNYGDGEEATLPVVSNRMLVTESLPLNMTGDGTKNFSFKKLLNSGSSETLNHHALTVEFTSNPAWQAVQALPYLMEYPYECAEQTFNRFYANALASSIMAASPRIQAIVEKWRTQDTAALLSNLQKNQELKSILLEETPWVLEGKTEAEQKQHIALLFNLGRMSTELTATIAKLADMQSANGAFPWFKGGPDDRFITQYILTGIGRLQKLHAIPASGKDRIDQMVNKALAWSDGQIKLDYEEWLRSQKNSVIDSTIRPVANTNKAGAKATAAAGKSARPGRSPIAKIHWVDSEEIQYLYMRSLFDKGIPGEVFSAVNHYRKEAQQDWTRQDKMLQGMIALALYRTGDIQTAKNIVASLKENAIRDEQLGMYWKDMERGYYWRQAPIETQALLIEAFQTIQPDASILRDCKTWLLRQKQTHSWPTTKATADACYALLIDNSGWLDVQRDVTIKLGDKTASTTAADAEAGTGYFKKVFDGPFVNPGMGNISVTMTTQPQSGAPATSPGAGGMSPRAGGTSPGAGGAGIKSTAQAKTGTTASATGLPAWGAVYWQYFDDLDKITTTDAANAPLRLTKKLFRQKNTDRGPVLEPVAENAALAPGDKVTVRIELHSDRDLEYVHMKDMRAAGMEPIDVISSYKWQDGLGYYQTTKDVSTDFFFSHISQGTYVFEYTLFAEQTGNFSNGVTSIECMYAPEFSFHSEGIRINIETPNP